MKFCCYNTPWVISCMSNLTLIEQERWLREPCNLVLSCTCLFFKHFQLQTLFYCIMVYVSGILSSHTVSPDVEPAAYLLDSVQSLLGFNCLWLLQPVNAAFKVTNIINFCTSDAKHANTKFLSETSFISH